MRMTDNEIREAAEAILNMRTRKKNMVPADSRYEKRLEIDSMIDEMKLKQREVWE